MATLKEQVKDTILSHPKIQHLVTFSVEIDDGSGDNSGDYVEPDVPFDETDPSLAYFDYTVDEETNTVEVVSIDYQASYDANGTYDITVPATLGGYPVVLNAS